MNLVEFSDDFARSVDNNMFWYKDTADTTDATRFLYNASDKATAIKS